MRTKLWDEIERHGATFMEIVPSILIAILNTSYKNFLHKQIESIDFIGCGSAFLPQNLQEAFEKRFGYSCFEFVWFVGNKCNAFR